MKPGRLFLVPAPLDFGCDASAPLTDVLPAGTIAQAAGLTHWICENAKSARAFLKRVGEVQPLAARSMRQVRISGSPTRAVGSSLSIASSSAMPSPSLLALPAQS